MRDGKNSRLCKIIIAPIEFDRHCNSNDSLRPATGRAERQTPGSAHSPRQGEKQEKSLDLHAFAAYKAATDPTIRRRMQGELVTANEDLISRCTKRFAGRGDTDDLLQAGRIGVMKALEKFQVRLPGNPLKAWKEFAKQWIWGEMMRGVVAVRAVVRTAPQVVDRIVDGKRTQKRVVSKPVMMGPGDGKCHHEPSTPRPGYNTILTPSFWRALASLTEQEARVFLAIVDEKTVTEVAAAEGHLVEWGTHTYRKAVLKLRAEMGAAL